MLENIFDKIMTGLEIKDWVWFNSHSDTKYTTLAKSMGSLFNLDNDKKYILMLVDRIPEIEEALEEEC